MLDNSNIKKKMKLLKTSLVLALVATMALACSKKPSATVTTVKLDEFFELKMNQTVQVVEAGLKLTFSAVNEDSRCPKFTNCIQEGQIKCTFTAVIDGKSQKVEMVRVPSQKGLISAPVGNYKVQLYDVMPYPENGKQINPADYSGRLSVRKGTASEKQ